MGYEYEDNDLFNIDGDSLKEAMEKKKNGTTTATAQNVFIAQDSIENRETVINGDDIINLQITLNTAKDFDSFLASI